MIIGIAGKIGSGKDTAAKIIQELIFRAQHEKYSEDTFKIKRFAGKLKFIVSLLTGIPVEDLEKQEVKDSTLPGEWNYLVNRDVFYPDNKGTEKVPFVESYTVRQMLQRVGTEAMRDQIHPNIWVNALFADYKDTSNWLIPDTRFINEAEAVKDRGGILIRINRPEDTFGHWHDKNSGFTYHTKKNPLFDAPIHPSETALDNYDRFDYVIDNDGTIEELTEKIKTILNQIIK